MLSPGEIQKKREEAERKARRGEIDPMQEFAFLVIGQVREKMNVLGKLQQCLNTAWKCLNLFLVIFPNF